VRRLRSGIKDGEWAAGGSKFTGPTGDAKSKPSVSAASEGFDPAGRRLEFALKSRSIHVSPATRRESSSRRGSRRPCPGRPFVATTRPEHEHRLVSDALMSLGRGAGRSSPRSLAKSRRGVEPFARRIKVSSTATLALADATREVHSTKARREASLATRESTATGGQASRSRRPGTGLEIAARGTGLSSTGRRGAKSGRVPPDSR
jgi:hypothetical protein